MCCNLGRLVCWHCSSFNFAKRWHFVVSFYVRLLSVLSSATLAGNEKGLLQVGNLKLVRPNVSLYKLLLFNYLQKYNKFPSAETKVQKNHQCSITSVRPTCHKPMLSAAAFCPPKPTVHKSVYNKLCTLGCLVSRNS